METKQIKRTPKYDKATLKALREQHQSIRQALAADLARVVNESFFDHHEGVIRLEEMGMVIYFSNQGDTSQRRRKLDTLVKEMKAGPYHSEEITRAYYPRPAWSDDPMWNPADAAPANAPKDDREIGYTCALAFDGGEDAEVYLQEILDEDRTAQVKEAGAAPPAAA